MIYTWMTWQILQRIFGDGVVRQSGVSNKSEQLEDAAANAGNTLTAATVWPTAIRPWAAAAVSSTRRQKWFARNDRSGRRPNHTRIRRWRDVFVIYIILLSTRLRRDSGGFRVSHITRSEGMGGMGIYSIVECFKDVYSMGFFFLFRYTGLHESFGFHPFGSFHLLCPKI